MSMTFDAAVIGGGFKGMMTAYGLIKQGKRVCIVDSGKLLGGFMAPMQWRGIEVDKGPQYLDGISEPHKRILDEITAGHEPLSALDYSYGSFWNDHYTEGFAIPDYRTLPVEQRALLLHEAITANEPPAQAKSIADLYGEDCPHSYRYIRQWCRKFLQNEADRLSTINRNFVTFFGRKLLLDNDLSLELKQHPRLDDILAARKSGIDHQTYNLYPLGKNLGVFREAFERWLHQAGAHILTETSVERILPGDQTYRLDSGERSLHASEVYCAATIESSERMLLQQDRISACIRPVAQLFYLLEIELDRPLPFYIMNYSDSSIARVTHFTAYANTSASNKSVLCVEVPTTVGSTLWENPDDHRSVLCKELQAMDIDTSTISAMQAFKVPSTYRAVLAGYEQQLHTLQEQVRERYGDAIHILTPHLLTRASIMADLSQRGILPS